MLVNPPQLVGGGKFLRINDMVAYMDLPRDVSYHSLHNLHVPLFEKRSVSISLNTSPQEHQPPCHIRTKYVKWRLQQPTTDY